MHFRNESEAIWTIFLQLDNRQLTIDHRPGQGRIKIVTILNRVCHAGVTGHVWQAFVMLFFITARNIKN